MNNHINPSSSSESWSRSSSKSSLICSMKCRAISLGSITFFIFSVNSYTLLF